MLWFYGCCVGCGFVDCVLCCILPLAEFLVFLDVSCSVGLILFGFGFVALVFLWILGSLWLWVLLWFRVLGFVILCFEFLCFRVFDLWCLWWL